MIAPLATSSNSTPSCGQVTLREEQYVINRRTFIASAAGLAVALAAGIAPAMAQGKGLVGISMPTKSSTRWISDGESMVKEFTALGYETDLQYAEDDIPNQLAQIENMVTKGAKVLIIAAIDGTTLSDILQEGPRSRRQGVRL